MDELIEERKRLDAEWSRLTKERAEFEQERIESGIEYKLFVGNLDESSEEDDIRNIFSPFGPIKEIVMLKTRDGKSKRSCFVKYFYKKSASAAIEALDGKVNDKDSPKELAIRYAESKRHPGVIPGMAGMVPGMPGMHGMTGMVAPQSFDGHRNNRSSPSDNKLFVGNLDETSTEEDMRNLFSTYGSIKEIVMFKNPDGTSKRSCFVKFQTKKAALASIDALNGKIKDKNSSKEIVIRFAQARLQSNVNLMQQVINPMSSMSNMNHLGMPGGPSAINNFPQSNFNEFNPYAALQAQQSAMMLSSGSSYGSPSYGPVVSHDVAATTRGPQGANLYVNNIGRNATADDLRAMFSDFGRVLSTKVFSGYGFVSFDNPHPAQEAINCLNGLMMSASGKRLEVSLKKDRPGGGMNSEKSQPRYTPY